MWSPASGGHRHKGDLIGPDGRGQPGGVDRATVWLFDAIKRQVNLACGLPIDVISANGSPALRTWLDSLRAPDAAHRFWAGAYDALPPSTVSGNAWLPAQRRFCIGYELPPLAQKLLQDIDVPYIDLRLRGALPR